MVFYHSNRKIIYLIMWLDPQPQLVGICPHPMSLSHFFSILSSKKQIVLSYFVLLIPMRYLLPRILIKLTFYLATSHEVLSAGVFFSHTMSIFSCISLFRKPFITLSFFLSHYKVFKLPLRSVPLNNTEGLY